MPRRCLAGLPRRGLRARHLARPAPVLAAGRPDRARLWGRVHVAGRLARARARAVCRAHACQGR
eukprot:10176505-Alexandrium_andersonii.AAC.1